MSRDYRLAFEDIFEGCERILRYTAGQSAAEFLADFRTVDAVIRNLEIIGEAAKHVPPSVRDRHPAVEWRKLAALRDVLAHGYFALDMAIICDVVENKIPVLHKQMQAILSLPDNG